MPAFKFVGLASSTMAERLLALGLPVFALPARRYVGSGSSRRDGCGNTWGAFSEEPPRQLRDTPP
jgi:hypothetical protein